MEKRLHRNEHDKVVAGVASGVATYLQVDVTIIRLLFVLSTIFLAGAGILVYIVLWGGSPVNNDPAFKYKQFNDLYSQPGSFTSNAGDVFNNPYQDPTQTKWNTPNSENNLQPNNMRGNDSGRTIFGLILLVLGVYFLLRQLDFIPAWFNIFHIYKLWPLAIIGFGISLIFKKKSKNEWETFKKSTEEAQRKTYSGVEEVKPSVEPSEENKESNL